MQEDDPSDGQERYFVLVDHEETHGVNVMDLGAQNLRSFKDLIIKEKKADIQALLVNLEREKYVMSFLEQENS